MVDFPYKIMKKWMTECGLGIGTASFCFVFFETKDRVDSPPEGNPKKNTSRNNPEVFYIILKII